MGIAAFFYPWYFAIHGNGPDLETGQVRLADSHHDLQHSRTFSMILSHVMTVMTVSSDGLSLLERKLMSGTWWEKQIHLAELLEYCFPVFLVVSSCGSGVFFFIWFWFWLVLVDVDVCVACILVDVVGEVDEFSELGQVEIEVEIQDCVQIADLFTDSVVKGGNSSKLIVQV